MGPAIEQVTSKLRCPQSPSCVCVFTSGLSASNSLPLRPIRRCTIPSIRPSIRPSVHPSIHPCAIPRPKPLIIHCNHLGLFRLREQQRRRSHQYGKESRAVLRGSHTAQPPTILIAARPTATSLSLSLSPPPPPPPSPLPPHTDPPTFSTLRDLDLAHMTRRHRLSGRQCS